MYFSRWQLTYKVIFFADALLVKVARFLYLCIVFSWY